MVDDRMRAEQGLTVTLLRLAESVDRIAQLFSHRNRLHPTDFRALVLIEGAARDDRVLTAGQLRQVLGVSSGATTYVIERLVAQGYAQRGVDPEDGRRALIRATENGSALAAEFLRAMQQVSGHAVTHISQPDLVALTGALRLLSECFEGHRAELLG